MALVDDALAQAGRTLADLSRIAVTVGPGSFTGIRVGVAAARGFALALGIEAVGVTTLSVLAAAHRQAESSSAANVVAVMDARRGEVYAQVFGPDGSALTEPAELAIAEAGLLPGRFAADVTGSGAPLLSGEAEGSGPDHFPVALVARLGADLAPGAARPKPLYLRAPDARPQTGFALSRA